MDKHPNDRPGLSRGWLTVYIISWTTILFCAALPVLAYLYLQDTMAEAGWSLIILALMPTLFVGPMAIVGGIVSGMLLYRKLPQSRLRTVLIAMPIAGFVALILLVLASL